MGNTFVREKSVEHSEDYPYSSDRFCCAENGDSEGNSDSFEHITSDEVAACKEGAQNSAGTSVACNSDPETDINTKKMGCGSSKHDDFSDMSTSALNRGEGQSTIDAQPKHQNNFSNPRNCFEVDIPKDLFIFFEYHMHSVENVGPSIEVKARENGSVFLQIESENIGLDRSKHPVFKVLSKLLSCQIAIDKDRLSYLDSHQGLKEIKDIERKNTCVIKINQPSSLLTATSPWGHRVCVCKGNIAYHDCQVLLLPLHAERSTWPGQIHQYLEKEYLPCNVEGYLRNVGPAPKERCLILPCPTDEKRYVVLFYVPSYKHGKELHNTREALTGMMQKAGMQAESIALPFDLILESGLKEKEILKIILPSVVDAFGEDTPICSLKLYLDEDSTDRSRLCAEVSKFLRSREWTSCGPCGFGRRRSVKLRVGDILDLEADVCVNSTNKHLCLNHGKLSTVLLKSAGKELADQCKERYPEGLTDHVVAVTDCFQLKHFEKIFHIVLPHREQKEEKILYLHHEWLRTRTRACLTLASAMKYESILFPTLGVGNLGYPPKEVAETMFSTFREFFTEMPDSSLQDVTVVCFHEDVPVYQTFKVVETRFGVEQTEDALSEVVLDLKGVWIHVIQGQPIQHASTADFVLESQIGPENSESDVSGRHFVHECNLEKEFNKKFSLFEKKRVVPYSVQINLDTFDQKLHRRVVASVEQCLPAAKKLKVVTLVVPKTEEVRSVHGMFKKAKENKDFGVPGPGGRSDGKRGKLTICGRVSDVKNTIKEVLNLPIPKDSPRFPQVDGSDSAQSAKRSNVSRRKGGGGRSKRTDDVEAAAEACEDDQLKADDHQLSATTDSPIPRPSVWSKEVDFLEYQALQFLLGQKLGDNFGAQAGTGEKILIQAKTANPPEEIIRKMDGIRREDMPMDGEGRSETFDTESEGIEAFIIGLPDQGRIALFCFDYSTMAKARHFVSVKTGKIKTTSRARRRFDESGASKQTVDQTPDKQQAWHQQMISLDQTTKSGRIKVSVYKTDITKLPVDAIVNAANEHLAHGGGVAYAIARAAGFALEVEGSEYINSHGPLKVSEVVMTTGGALPCKKVLHAVGPRWSDYKDKSQCCQDLAQAVFNCLSLASKQGFTSIAVSSISSAIFGVPQQTCSGCYLAAVQRFDDECGHSTSLTHIHFVDVNDSMVSTIQNTFRNLWNTTISVQQLGCQVPSSQGDNFSVSESGGRRRRRRPQTTNPEVQPSSFNSNPEVQPSLLDPNPKVQLLSPDPNSEVQPLLPDPEQVGGNQGMDVLHGRSLQESKIVEFKYQGISVLFPERDIFDVSTDALVLWQTEGYFLKDTFSVKFMSVKSEAPERHGVKELPVGEVDNMYSGNTLVLFPCVSMFHSESQHEIHTVLQKLLIKVSDSGRKSVAVPRYPYGRHDSDEELRTFGAALYESVKSVSQRRRVGVNEIQVFDPEERSREALVKFFGSHL